LGIGGSSKTEYKIELVEYGRTLSFHQPVLHFGRNVINKRINNINVLVNQPSLVQQILEEKKPLLGNNRLFIRYKNDSLNMNYLPKLFYNSLLTRYIIPSLKIGSS